MVESLPQPIRQRLNATLAQWRQWHPTPERQPDPVSLLSGGTSGNCSVVVATDTHRWVVRVDGDDPRRLGLSREAEWRALQRAGGAGLAPQAAYRNPELGALVSGFLEVTTKAAPLSQNQRLDQTATLLRKIHQLPPLRFRLDPLSRANSYRQLAGLDSLPREFEEACKALARESVDLVVCHNDLLRANRLETDGGLYAIDWEYVAMGDGLFDLAAIIEGDGLDPSDTEHLCCAWNGEPLEHARQRRLEIQRLVYCELSRLWEQALAVRSV